MVLLRFAPSPTGPLHLGGLRMALYNHLFARKHGGKWILRIEDTDRTRYVPGSVQGIQEGLQWAGLDYDFGPGKEGPMGPFYQSERLDLYRTYAKRLLDTGHAYRCFCSPDRLSEIREALARSGSQASYDRTCLHLSEEEVARRVKAGEKHTVRLNDNNVPARELFTDIVFGAVRDSTKSASTDPVLLKSDMFPTYHLASVVDDHEMGITHVLRGEEWLPSVALHLNIYASLGIKPPKFAHIPILLNPDRTKMSKRHGDVQVVDYQRRGWEPVAVLNWLALSGWGGRMTEEENCPDPSQHKHHSHHHDAPDSTKVMDMKELLSEFDLSVITTRANVLDGGKLDYLNKQHLIRAWSNPEGLDKLVGKVHQQIKDAFPTSEFTTNDYIKKVVLLLEGRLHNITDIPSLAPYMFQPPDLTSDDANYMAQKIDPKTRVLVFSTVRDALKVHHESEGSKDGFGTGGGERLRKVLADVEKKMASESQIAGHKEYMMCMRYALCGVKDGPSLVDVMHLLGYEKVCERLRYAIEVTEEGI